MTETTTARVFDPDLFNSATGAGLIYFLERMVQLNELGRGSVDSLRVGCRKVMDAEENSESMNLREVDLETIFRRFRNMTRGKLKPGSVAAYEKRFRQSVDMYIKYLDEDPSWNIVKPRTPKAETKPKSTSPTKAASAPDEPQPPMKDEVPASGVTAPLQAPPAPPGVQTVTVPVPLRKDGTQATIILPVDATEREVKKVAQIIELYAMTEQLAITAGQ